MDWHGRPYYGQILSTINMKKNVKIAHYAQTSSDLCCLQTLTAAAIPQVAKRYTKANNN